MPNSRRRRPKRSDQRSRKGPRQQAPKSRDRGIGEVGSDRFQRNMAALFAADRAEALGDALGALDVMEDHLAGHPDGEVFWRPWRMTMLMQLVLLRPILPKWVTSRWILAQGLQHLEPVPDGRARARTSGALKVAIELRGGAGQLPGTDEVDAQCRVMDHDWVYRQLHLYDLGGLEHFLERAATADLVVGADRIRDWAATPMGGYRLLGHRPATTTWGDLASGQTIETANVGSAALLVPGECVIGRMVPIEGGAMFEGAPLRVPEPVARRVADDPADWVEVLRSVPGGTDGPEVGCAGDVHGLLSDVPTEIWTARLQDADGIVRLAEQTLDRTLMATEDEIEPWSALAAALVSCSAISALSETAGPEHAPLLSRLGEELAEPAAGFCRMLVDALSEAA